MDDRIDEILARLDALERRLDDVERAGPRCSFCEEERRIIDTIVRLTTESIVHEIDARMEGRHEHGHPHGPPPPHHPPPPGPPDRRRRR